MKREWTKQDAEIFEAALADALQPVCSWASQELGLDPEILQASCVRYGSLLMQRNAQMNLTALTDPKEIAEKHILDCLLPIPLLQRMGLKPEGDTPWLDVGSGAGFPGLVFQLTQNWGPVTLLDSLQKRLRFLQEVAQELDIPRVSVLHGRAEEWGQTQEHREKYGFAVARAVAGMPVLAELVLPFVRVGGLFLAMKGPLENPEEAQVAIQRLGGAWEAREQCFLPDGSERQLWLIRKVRSTPRKYPRRPGDPARKPLK